MKQEDINALRAAAQRVIDKRPPWDKSESIAVHTVWAEETIEILDALEAALTSQRQREEAIVVVTWRLAGVQVGEPVGDLEKWQTAAPPLAEVEAAMEGEL